MLFRRKGFAGTFLLTIFSCESMYYWKRDRETGGEVEIGLFGFRWRWGGATDRMSSWGGHLHYNKNVARHIKSNYSRKEYFKSFESWIRKLFSSSLIFEFCRAKKLKFYSESFGLIFCNLFLEFIFFKHSVKQWQ